MNRTNALYALFAALLVLGFAYTLADSEATKSINAVAESMEIVDYGTAFDGSWLYTYRLSNPTRWEVEFSYYADIYIGETYISSLQYSVRVPPGRSVTIEVSAHLGVGAVSTLLAAGGEPGYRFEVACSGRCIFIEKSWSWDYTP